MKVITAEMMREIDKATIEDHGIPGLDLMESAGSGVAHKIIELLGDTRGHSVSIFCGRGNNGGDGFVVARHLAEEGLVVKVFLLTKSDDIKGDALHNYKRLPERVTVIPITSDDDISEIAEQMTKESLIVDAILGTGLKGAVKGEYARIIGLINDSGAQIVAIDIPSGVEGSTGKIGSVAVKADHTCTMAMPKLGHFLQPGCECTGELEVIDIGIPTEVLDKFDIKYEALDNDKAKGILPSRLQVSHKGDFGRVLVIGGSTGVAGAVAMTSNAVLRSGAGMVIAATPETIQKQLAVKLTEPMTKPLKETDSGTVCADSFDDIKPLLDWADIIAVGMGIGVNDDVRAFMERLIDETSLPLVIDADGITAVTAFRDKLSARKSPIVITPHPGELAAFSDVPIDEIMSDYFHITLDIAQKFGITVLLKVHRSVTACNDGRASINLTGNSGMATAGSGDVLTGIIAGLLAQGADIYNAARLGAYIHGLAGDIAAENLTEFSLIASDISNNLPKAFTRILTGD